MIFSKWAREISKILFILGSYNFLAYLECVRSYAWSKGHSDPDLGSVNCNIKEIIMNLRYDFFHQCDFKSTLALFWYHLVCMWCLKNFFEKANNAFTNSPSLLQPTCMIVSCYLQCVS